MSNSLFYQFNSAIDLNYRHHFNKYGDKHNPESDSSHIVKSSSAKSNLKDFAHDFAAFIKSEYGVKQVRQITTDMCQSYIERKSAEGCSLKTIKTYQSNLLKISKCANKTFNIRTDFSVTIDESKIEKTETIKQFSFTRSEMEKILAAPRSCDSLIALKFAYQTGVRVNTLERLEVRHIDFKNGEITVFKDKGNRTRVLPMSEETAKLLRQQIKGKSGKDRVFSVKKGSVNRYLRRRCEKLNLRTPNGEIKSGVHSIRKLWAEEHCKVHGKGATLKALGHGEQRSDLEQTYLHSKK